MNIPWPDIKRFESKLSEASPNGKKPSWLIMSQDTFRDLRLGPAAQLWIPFISEEESETLKGNRAHILGIPILVRGNTPRTIQMVWAKEGEESQVYDYSWELPTLESLSTLTIELAHQLSRAEVQEDEEIKRLTLNCDSLEPDELEQRLEERLSAWMAAEMNKGRAKQRLFTLYRVIRQIRARRRKSQIPPKTSAAVVEEKQSEPKKSSDPIEPSSVPVASISSDPVAPSAPRETDPSA